MNNNVIEALFGGISILMITGCSKDPVLIIITMMNRSILRQPANLEDKHHHTIFNGITIQVYVVNSRIQGIEVAVIYNICLLVIANVGVIWSMQIFFFRTIVKELCGQLY